MLPAGCNHVSLVWTARRRLHVFKGPCVLELNHAGPHQWRNPDATGPSAQSVIGSTSEGAAAPATAPNNQEGVTV